MYACVHGRAHTHTHTHTQTWGFPGDASGKEPTYQCRRHAKCEFDPCMATQSRILAWRILRTEEPGRL